MCGEAILASGTDEPQIVRRRLSGAPLSTVHGDIRIDAETNHAALPFHLGRITTDNGFDIIASRPAIAADPYLTGRRKRPAPKLQIVS
jgi:branched-chain amino acid transport system substrate-binding protein